LCPIWIKGLAVCIIELDVLDINAICAVGLEGWKTAASPHLNHADLSRRESHVDVDCVTGIV
jgi:hypothetical protein